MIDVEKIINRKRELKGERKIAISVCPQGIRVATSDMIEYCLMVHPITAPRSSDSTFFIKYDHTIR